MSETAPDAGRASLWRHVVERLSSPMNEKETGFVEAIGMAPSHVSTSRVLIRRPLTIAVERHFYFPGLFAATVVFMVALRHGVLPALAAAAVGGLMFTLSLVAHECGHLLLGRHVRGITPRILLLRSAGGVAIVEGRYADARGAALFAAGGPLATLAVTLVLLVAGVMLPVGPFAMSLIIPAVLNLLLLGINLLPVAPTDGYLLLRSAFWASVGSRTEAERYAIRWSGRVIVFGFAISLLVFYGNPFAGLVAFTVCATLAVQHRAAARQLAPRPRAH